MVDENIDHSTLPLYKSSRIHVVTTSLGGPSFYHHHHQQQQLPPTAAATTITKKDHRMRHTMMSMMTHPSKRIVDVRTNLTKKIFTKYIRFHDNFSIVLSSTSLSSPLQLPSVQTKPVDRLQKVLSLRSYSSWSSSSFSFSFLSSNELKDNIQTQTKIGKQRTITTTAAATKDDDSNNDERKKETILYERNGKQYNIMPRSALFVSLFNTTYWLWYVLDFIPAVNNASTIETMLHVDPTIGYVGIGLGVAINSITLFYPTLLISKITVVSSSSPASSSTTTTTSNDNTRLLRVYMHSLPFIRPCTTPSLELECNYNANKNDEFLVLDISSKDAKKIINEYNGDISLFRGHLGLTSSKSGRYLPYLLSIQDSTEVQHSTLLFQLLTMNSTTTTSSSNNKRNMNTQKTKKENADDEDSSTNLQQNQQETTKRIQKIQQMDLNKKNKRMSTPSSNRNKKKKK